MISFTDDTLCVFLCAGVFAMHLHVLEQAGQKGVVAHRLAVAHHCIRIDMQMTATTNTYGCTGDGRG